MNIIHGDIKPENILFDGKSATIIDFDHASTKDVSNPDDIGTDSFQPPEILNGADHTPARDIWSLGVTIVALVYCTNLFIDKDTNEVSGYHVEEVLERYIVLDLLNLNLVRCQLENLGLFCVNHTQNTFHAIQIVIRSKSSFEVFLQSPHQLELQQQL